MRKVLVVLSLSMLVSGCALTPMTREEFVQANRNGVMFGKVDTHTSQRPFKAVVTSLEQKSAECFNVDTTTRRIKGGVATSSITDQYRTTLRVEADRAELTTQRTSKGITYLQKIPEGGFYDMAVDIEELTPKTTKLTYYGASFNMKTWGAIKTWSDGQSAPCP